MVLFLACEGPDRERCPGNGCEGPACLSGKRAGRPLLPTAGQGGAANQLPSCFWPAPWLCSSHKDGCVGSVFLSQIVTGFPPQNSAPAFHVASLTATGCGVRRNLGFQSTVRDYTPQFRWVESGEASHTHCLMRARLGLGQEESSGVGRSPGSIRPRHLHEMPQTGMMTNPELAPDAHLLFPCSLHAGPVRGVRADDPPCCWGHTRM